MSKQSSAFVSMTYKAREVFITFKNGDTWAYPVKPIEYASMHRKYISAGRYFCRVLKPRGGRRINEPTLTLLPFNHARPEVSNASQSLFNMLTEGVR